MISKADLNKAWIEYDGETDAFGISIQARGVTYSIVDLWYEQCEELITTLSEQLKDLNEYRTSNQTAKKGVTE